MIHTQFENPQLMQWQARLARIPRWGWIAFSVGVLVPLVLVGLMLLLASLFTGLIVLAAAVVIGALAGAARRLLNRGTRDLSHRTGHSPIIVSSARVIDP